MYPVLGLLTITPTPRDQQLPLRTSLHSPVFNEVNSNTPTEGIYSCKDMVLKCLVKHNQFIRAKTWVNKLFLINEEGDTSTCQKAEHKILCRAFPNSKSYNDIQNLR